MSQYKLSRLFTIKSIDDSNSACDIHPCSGAIHSLHPIFGILNQYFNSQTLVAMFDIRSLLVDIPGEQVC